MVELQTGLALTLPEAEAALAAWLGDGVRCTRIERLHGGMINSVLRLEFDREPFSAVVKLNAEGESFAWEARALAYLRDAGFPCPAAYLEDGSTSHIPYAFLLLETIPGVSLAEAHLTPADRDRIDLELAEVLLKLHAHTRDAFGPIDGKPGKERWVDVFLPRLLTVRGEEEVNRRLPKGVLDDVDHAIGAAEEVMGDQGRPTLVHGDIWAGNVIVDRARDGWYLAAIVDPGVQYADVELELAYLKVFATAGPAFFEAYTARSPLRSGYETRRLFYWLHTYLIHVWLFGDQRYRNKTALMAAEIARRV